LLIQLFSNLLLNENQWQNLQIEVMDLDILDNINGIQISNIVFNNGSICLLARHLTPQFNDILLSNKRFDLIEKKNKHTNTKYAKLPNSITKSQASHQCLTHLSGICHAMSHFVRSMNGRHQKAIERCQQDQWQEHKQHRR
jgi:hypothetical protein